MDWLVCSIPRECGVSRVDNPSGAACAAAKMAIAPLPNANVAAKCINEGAEKDLKKK